MVTLALTERFKITRSPQLLSVSGRKATSENEVTKNEDKWKTEENESNTHQT